MAIVVKSSIKSNFETGDKPTQADFVELIDESIPNWFEDWKEQIDAGTVGVIEVISTASATTRSIGVVGAQVLAAATTAAAQGDLGGGTGGIAVFEAASTAAAVNALGAGTVGAQLLTVETTASANNIVGGGSSEWGTLIATVSANNSANIEFKGANGLDATYTIFTFVFYDLVPATNNTALEMVVSDDDGVTYESTLYRWTLDGTAGAGTGLSTGATAGTEARIAGSTAASRGIGNGAAEAGAAGILRAMYPSRNGRPALFMGQSTWESDDGVGSIANVAFLCDATTSPIDAVRFAMSSGNITTGIFKLFGSVLP